jgi:hypothetical protein
METARADQIVFRGSVIDHMEWDPVARVVQFHVALCNYNQHGYNANKDSETIQGLLRYENAILIKVEPEDALSRWDVGTDAEILELGTIMLDAKRALVKLVMKKSDYAAHSEETYIVEFQANTAQWCLA